MNRDSIALFIGQRVRQARRENHMSQMTLSEKVGLRQATLSDIENGKTMTGIHNLMAIAEVLNRPLVHFIKPRAGSELTDLNPWEEELLRWYRTIENWEVCKVAVDLIRCLVSVGAGS